MSCEACVDNGSMGSTGKVEQQPVTANLYLKVGKVAKYIKFLFSMTQSQYLGWFGSGGSEWDRSARALLGKIFCEIMKTCLFLIFWFSNFPSPMFCLPCDQVLLVSLIAINDGHLHRHPVQVDHSPHLTRIHINHLQGQPTRTNAITRSTKLVFSLPEMAVCWQRHPGPARWWSSEGFRWLSCHTTIKVSPHI